MTATTGWQTYKRLLGYSKTYWRAFALGILGFIINAQTEWAAAEQIKFIINAIQEKNQGCGYVHGNVLFIFSGTTCGVSITQRAIC